MSNQRPQQNIDTGGRSGQVTGMELFNDPAVVHVAPAGGAPIGNPTIRVVGPVGNVVGPRMIVPTPGSVQVAPPPQIIQMPPPPPAPTMHQGPPVIPVQQMGGPPQPQPMMQPPPAPTMHQGPPMIPVHHMGVPRQPQPMMQPPPILPSAMNQPVQVPAPVQPIIHQGPEVQMMPLPAPPTTLPGHFLSHSEGFMTTPIQMGVPQHQSLPMLGGSKKRVIIPDVNGIERPHPVTDATLQQVRAVIEVAEINAARMDVGHQSLGSLPSGSSNLSSLSSIGSSVSHSYNPQMASSDPIIALQEYSNMLLRSGHIHELHHFKNFLDLKLAPSQTGPNVFLPEVSQCPQEHECIINEFVNNVKEPSVTSQNYQHMNGSANSALTETSSENLHEHLSCNKHKKGVFSKLNSVVSRLLAARL